MEAFAPPDAAQFIFLRLASAPPPHPPIKWRMWAEQRGMGGGERKESSRFLPPRLLLG